MIYEESTLLRFKRDRDWIHFKVRNRRERWAHTFYCTYDKLIVWLQGGTSAYLEMDGHRLLKATQVSGQVTLSFFWFNVHDDGRLTGSTDTVHLDKETFLAQLLAGTPGKAFSHLHKFDAPTRFDFSTAQKTLRKAIAAKAAKEHSYLKETSEQIAFSVLKQHSVRLFDDPLWVDYLNFNQQYRPEILADVAVARVRSACCQRDFLTTQALLDSSCDGKTCCQICGRWAEYEVLASGVYSELRKEETP